MHLKSDSDQETVCLLLYILSRSDCSDMSEKIIQVTVLTKEKGSPVK